MSTQARLHRWQSMKKEELSPSIGRKMITGERMMIAQIFLKKGSVVPRHHHVKLAKILLETYEQTAGISREFGLQLD